MKKFAFIGVASSILTFCLPAYSESTPSKVVDDGTVIENVR
jgi:hypothetical protein